MTSARQLLDRTKPDLALIHARCSDAIKSGDVVDPLLASHLVREMMNGLARCTLDTDHKRGKNVIPEIDQLWTDLLAKVLRPLLGDAELWERRTERDDLEKGIRKISEALSRGKVESDAHKRNVAQALTRIVGHRITQENPWVARWIDLVQRGVDAGHYRGPRLALPAPDYAAALTEDMDDFLASLTVSPTEGIDRVDDWLGVLNAE